MTDNKIRQVDLENLENKIKVYIHQTLWKFLWVLAPALIGATVKLLEVLRNLAARVK